MDPNPNPQEAYEERVRLFENVQGWEHYNTDLISQGGGVFSRSAKSIPISTEVQQMLGLLKDQTELAPEVVIRILLRLDVDLLWNGGIGTYVKSTDETHMDAGDPSNDNLRVNGSEVRARIVGEGGNLGFTQNGRIEYALSGGRLNTDAIDNSGGVDMSDHEVNLKILLNPLVANGSLALDDRNTLLESMTEEVAQDVLETMIVTVVNSHWISCVRKRIQWHSRLPSNGSVLDQMRPVLFFDCLQMRSWQSVRRWVKV